MLALRTAMGLTQESLAERLCVSRKTIGRWEAGESYPGIAHLKVLVAVAIEKQAFPSGQEQEAIRAFWQKSHRNALLDERWLQALLDAHRSHRSFTEPGSEIRTREQTSVSSTGNQSRVDWGEALDVSIFYGRAGDLNLLSRWIVQEQYRMVGVLGLGGIGKSAVATKCLHLVAAHFDVVIWRSLRDAPSCEALLDDCFQILAPQDLREVSMSLEQRLRLLLKHLRANRVLLVLDNLEVLLEDEKDTGHMRPGYEGYGRLLSLIAETDHQSCLLFTSREKPSILVPLEGSRVPVGVLRLARLDVEACRQLLAEKGVVGSAAEQERLIEAYGGNPLALKIVASTIVDLFSGEITLFMQQGNVVFGGVRELLNEQYARLSKLAQQLLGWLAIVREPVSIEELLNLQGMPIARAYLLEAVDSLRRRSLIEQGRLSGSLTLQSVVLEYVTAQLIAELAAEIEHNQPQRLIEHGLELAMSKEYVRQTQRRLIVSPLLMHVRKAYSGYMEVDTHLLTLLDSLRARSVHAQGYGPANVLALLREFRGHLRGLDLSSLAIRGAVFQGTEMQDTQLTEATLRDTTFTEALDAIRTVALSSDGSLWAAGSWRGKVRVWRQGGKILHLAWQAHTSTVSSLAFSPDGLTLATGSWDGALKLWEVESGSLLWTSWRTNNIQSLAFMPGGQMIVSGGNDGAVQLWDSRDGKHVMTLSGQSGAVYALAWHPTGELLASGGLDGQIRLWRWRGTQPAPEIRILTGHRDWVFSLAFSPDGKTLASGSFDRMVRLWDTESWQVRETLPEHMDRVRALAWSSDGRFLASCGFDQLPRVWDVERGSYCLSLQGHTGAVTSIAFTPDRRHLLTGSDDNTLRVWDVVNGQCIYILQGYAVSLYDVAWHPDGARLASADSDAVVTVWEMGSGAVLKQFRGHRWIVHGIAWSPDGHFLASCAWDSTVRVWDIETGGMHCLMENPGNDDTFFYGVTWSPDGKYLASGNYQGRVYVWDAASGACRWIGHLPPAIIRRVEWSPDGTLLASCSDNGSISLWDAATGQLQRSLQGSGSMVKSIAWNADSSRLASCGGGQGHGEIFIWDVQSGECLDVLTEVSGIPMHLHGHQMELPWSVAVVMACYGGGM
ncbi:NB-ARC domain-containing protein [Dictyobacter alpinus]|nr:NB-ARC domain-containing protein [Dictyobacter alpinus]